MPPTANRLTRSNNLDKETRRSGIEQQVPKGGEDSDSLMSGGGSDDEDDEQDTDDEEEGRTQNRNQNSNFLNDELKMPPYEHAKRQLSHLYELMNGPYLDLAPHYQRGVVWSRKAMSLLIDSMLKGYYIPPVIFNLEIVKDDNGTMRFKRTCVDGKQRLTSIREFMSGQFACRINKKPWYFCAPPGPNRQGPRKKILPESVKEEFRKIELLCTEYKGLTERQEIELFQRVQLGKPLSQAEAFRATQGSWQEFAKLYERDFSDVINLVKQHRASGFRAILNCFMQIYECIDPTGADGIPKFKNSIKSIESFCSNAILDMETKLHLRFVFALFHDLVEEDPSTFHDNGYTRIKTFAPIELIGVCCLLSQKGAERPNGMLRGDILAMRAHLREIHSDLRMNKTCWQSVWRFIDKLEYYRGGVGGSTVPKAPAKAIKRKTRPRLEAQAAPVVDGGSVVPGGPSSRPPAANMTQANARPRPSAGQRVHDDNLASGSLLNQLSAAASRGGAPNNDLNAALNATRSMASHSTTPSITPNSNQGQSSRLSALTSDTSRSNNDHISTGDVALSNRRTSSTSLAPSPTSVETTSAQGLGSAPGPRKRVALDLGPNATGNKELEIKKARLMAGYVKQEKDT